MLSPEELLSPRYKVTGPYPHSPYQEGEQVKSLSGRFHITTSYYYDEFGDKQPVETYVPEKTLLGYPNLFQPLPWYVDRKPEDLPEYVKDEEGCCYKVQEWHTELASMATVFIDTKIHKGYIESCTECPIYCDIFPATEAEFLTYKNKNNG